MKDRQQTLKERQEETRRLEEETKKMEAELEKIRKLKQMEFEKTKLQMELREMAVLNKTSQQAPPASLTQPKSSSNKSISSNSSLSKTKASEQTDKTALTIGSNAHKAPPKKPPPLIPPSLEAPPQDTDTYSDNGDNLKYFLSVMGLQKYWQTLMDNKIDTLAKLKNTKEDQAKKIGIEFKDMVKIVKKLRGMGI